MILDVFEVIQKHWVTAPVNVKMIIIDSGIQIFGTSSCA